MASKCALYSRYTRAWPGREVIWIIEGDRTYPDRMPASTPGSQRSLSRCSSASVQEVRGKRKPRETPRCTPTPRLLLTWSQYNSGAFDRQLTFLRLPGLSPDYKLGSGDEIEVTIVGSSSGPATYSIDRSGGIVIPLVGTVKVSGLTAEEAEKAIAHGLAQAELVRNAEVLVYISAYQAKPIYVVGELDRQGQYFMSQQLTLMDLIFLSGGLDFTAARYGYLHRKVSPDGPEVPPQAALENPEAALPGMTVIKSI
jgi:hypothetical protein